METLNYWNGNGKFQKELDELYEEFLPFSEKAKTHRGEVLRAANMLYYERFNNGNLNAVEEAEDENGETYYKITPFFQDLISIVKHVLSGEGLKAAERIKECLTYVDDPSLLKIFDKDYETMMDSVIIWVKNETKDEEIPVWYEN